MLPFSKFLKSKESELKGIGFKPTGRNQYTNKINDNISINGTYKNDIFMVTGALIDSNPIPLSFEFSHPFEGLKKSIKSISSIKSESEKDIHIELVKIMKKNSE